MVKIMKIQPLLFILGCFVSFTLMAADIKVTSDRNPVGLNESFQLVYQTSGSVDDDPDFSPLEKQLDILNRSQNSNISYINGQYSSSKSWTLTVMAKHAGELTLPPISFGADLSPSYQLRVTPASANAPDQDGFFTRVKVEQQQYYVQQQIVITQQLFSPTNLAAYALEELNFSGVDVVTVPLGEEKQYQTRINDRAYLVVEKSYAVYPQQNGTLQVQAALAEARIAGGGSTLFDSFANRGKVVRARSTPVDITVSAVPANINIRPWLPAADLQVLEQWPDDPPRFIQGEPITRTLSLKAEGLTAAQLPEMPEINIDGFKQYPDQPLLNDVKNDSGITGYRVEKVAIIPTGPGTFTLPQIEIPWWDTKTQSRQVAGIPARTVQVVASAQAPAQAPAIQVQPAEIEQQPAIEEAVRNNGSLSEELEQQTSELWKFIALLLAAGWLLTLLFWFWQSRKKYSQDVPEARSPESSIKTIYQKLFFACDKRDMQACRQYLLAWGQRFYPDKKITVLSDLKHLLPLEVAGEVNKIDAVLYGAKKQTINFEIIKKQVQTLSKHKQGTHKAERELLEPLYK